MSADTLRASRQRMRRAALRVLAAVALTIGAVAPAAAAVGDELEHAVKAAYLYKFAGFVEWPAGVFASPDEPLVFGVVGSDAIADELAQAVRGRSVAGRPLRVRRIAAGEAFDGLHLLFIGRGEAARMHEIVRAVRPRAVLTVADMPGALDRGAIVNLLLVDDRVRFEVALDAAERAGVKLNARLLAVAYRVRQAPPH